MDLERAREYAHEIEELKNRINNTEPQNAVEGLSPTERFDSIANRIESLPTTSQELGGSLLKNLEIDLGDKLSLHLSTNYDATGGKTPKLYVIEASWQLNKNQSLAVEQLWSKDLSGPDAPRVLGLLEESVSAAENELRTRNGRVSIPA